ncbi:MAG TPA: CsgG/HfaB family protein [Steroidobacteraceae bacterium]|nr:CsgG/HfaB family protein [Steroidobacteraceae bacterium]
MICAAIGAAAVAADDPGVTGYQEGKGASPIQGAAGPNGSAGDSGLAHCDRPMAAVTVVEPQTYVTQALHRYELQSPTPLIRMMIQQSNCFIVVERGAAMQNMEQERELAAAGQLRSNSNMGGGQLVTADFIITPSVVFSEHNAGGVGGGVGGVISEVNPLAGVLVGGLKFKEAQTSMLLTDARSGVQVAAAEGSTRKADFRLGAALFGRAGFGGAHGYGNSNEGKIIAAAFLDNYKKIVGVVRGDSGLQREVGTLQEEAANGGRTQAGVVFNEGDVVTPKINNVRLLAAAADGAQSVATVNRGDELVVIGAEQNGYIYAQGSVASGWVKKALMMLH